MASTRARDRRAQEQALEQWCRGDTWQDARDADDDDVPDRDDEPLPVHTTH